MERTELLVNNDRQTRFLHACILLLGRVPRVLYARAAPCNRFVFREWGLPSGIMTIECNISKMGD